MSRFTYEILTTPKPDATGHYTSTLNVEHESGKGMTFLKEFRNVDKMACKNMARKFAKQECTGER